MEFQFVGFIGPQKDGGQIAYSIAYFWVEFTLPNLIDGLGQKVENIAAIFKGQV